jgi:hypothetical protein
MRVYLPTPASGEYMSRANLASVFGGIHTLVHDRRYLITTGPQSRFPQPGYEAEAHQRDRVCLPCSDPRRSSYLHPHGGWGLAGSGPDWPVAAGGAAGLRSPQPCGPRWRWLGRKCEPSHQGWRGVTGARGRKSRV